LNAATVTFPNFSFNGKNKSLNFLIVFRICVACLLGVSVIQLKKFEIKVRTATPTKTKGPYFNRYFKSDYSRGGEIVSTPHIEGDNNVSEATLNSSHFSFK
jgi:hypothetical protein